MAGRPVKRSADWFPHDAHASDKSKTLTILEARYGAEGYMAWFKLLERLTTTNDHTLICSSAEDTEFLAAKLKLTRERFEEFVTKAAELGGIDADLWQHRVIWCQNLVDNLKPVYDNRKQDPPHKPAISTTGNAISRLEMPISRIDSTPPPKPVLDSFNIAPPSYKSRGSRVEKRKKSRVELTHPTLPQSPDGELVGSALSSFQLFGVNHIKLRDGDLIEARSACRKYSPEWIKAAVKESCVQNKTTWSYTAAILRRWESEGKR